MPTPCSPPPRADAVVHPQRGDLARRRDGDRPFVERGVVGAGVAHILVGVGGDHVPARYRLYGGFQLEALRAHLAGLRAVRAGRIVQVGRQHIGLVDPEDRCGDRSLAAGLDLHPGFDLAALGRPEGLAVAVGADGWVERGRIAQVRRDAVRRQVHHAHAAGEGGIALAGGGAAEQVIGARFAPVVAAAQREDPALAQLDLVLQVEAEQGLALADVLRRRTRAAEDRQVGRPIHRVVQIERRGEGVILRVLGGLALVVDTGQQCVPHGAGRESGLRLRVEVQPPIAGLGDTGVAQQGAPRRGARVQADAVGHAVVELEVHVARVLAHRPGVVQAMLELVAQRILRLLVRVEIRRAGEQRGGDPAVRVRQDGALRRQETVRRVGLVAQGARQQRQRGVGQWLPGQRRRDHQALVVERPQRQVAVACQGGQAVRQLAVGIERAGKVAGHLLARVAAVLHFDLVDGLGGRLLGDDVDGAARVALAIQHGGRPPQQFDALDLPRVDAPAGQVDGVGQLQAIQVGGRHEAAHGGVPVRAGPRAVARHRCRIVQRLVDALRTLGLEAIARHHADRLRNLLDRRIGFGAGGAAPGHVAAHRTVGGFGLSGGGDGGRQGDFGAAAGRFDGEGIVALSACRQPGLRQQAMQCLFDAVAALHARGRLAGRQRAGEHELGTRLARQRGQRRIERLGGNVDGHARLRDGGAGKQRGGGQCGQARHAGPAHRSAMSIHCESSPFVGPGHRGVDGRGAAHPYLDAAERQCGTLRASTRMVSSASRRIVTGRMEGSRSSSVSVCALSKTPEICRRSSAGSANVTGATR